MKRDGKQARLKQAFGSYALPRGDAVNQAAMLRDQGAPGVVNGGHVLPVGLLLLPFFGVLPLGERVVEETSAGVTGKS